MLIIGATVALFAAGGTLAPFTDSQTITGDVNAGTVNLYISDVTGSDDTGEDEAIFDGTAENLLPGGSTSWVVRLLNTGANAWDWTSTTNNSTNLECDGDNAGDDFSVSWADTTDHGSDNHGAAHVAPGGAEDITVTVSLAAAADDSCQGAVANVSLLIGVTGH
jgi:predicted ribosomally synthesized peptide with SipW-like signal peptide